MRALIVAAAPTAGSPALVAELARDHDLVIAADAGGAVCQEANVTPHVLVGDFDSLGSDVRDALADSGAEVVSYPADKDATDLELAIGEAVSRGARTVTLTAAAANRLDHTLGALAAAAGAVALAPKLCEPELSAWLLGDQGRREVLLGGVGGTISLVAWAGHAVSSASGVRWPLTHETLEPTSARTLSNEIVSDPAVVEVHSGLLWVFAPHIDGAARVLERER